MVIGHVIGEETLSYLVEVNRKRYHQKCKWLSPTPKELMESVETNLNMTDPTELVESSSAELPQPTIPPSVVSGPHTEGRPEQDHCPPPPTPSVAKRLRVLK